MRCPFVSRARLDDEARAADGVVRQQAKEEERLRRFWRGEQDAHASTLRELDIEREAHAATRAELERVRDAADSLMRSLDETERALREWTKVIEAVQGAVEECCEPDLLHDRIRFSRESYLRTAPGEEAPQ